MAEAAPSLEPAQRASTGVPLSIALTIAALYFGSDIFVPIAISILLSFVLAPGVRLLRRWHLGRVVPVLAMATLAVVAIASISAAITLQLRDLTTDLPRYEDTVRRKIEAVRGMSEGRLKRLTDLVSILSQDLSRKSDASETVPGLGGAPAKPIPVVVRAPEPTTLDTLGRILAPLLHPLATLGIVVVFVIFILLQREDLRNRLIRLVGAGDLHRSTAALDDAATAPEPFARLAIGAQHGRGAPGRRGPLGDRRAESGPVGHPLRVPSLRTLSGAAARRHSADRPCGRGRPRLGHDTLDHRHLRDHRIAGRPGDRTLPLRPQHGAVAGRNRPLGHVLDGALGADRPHPVDPDYGLSRRARAARGPSSGLRPAARRPAAADALRDLLPAHARQRPHRGRRSGPADAAADRPHRLLRHGGAPGASAGPGGCGPGPARSRPPAAHRRSRGRGRRRPVGRLGGPREPQPSLADRPHRRARRDRGRAGAGCRPAARRGPAGQMAQARRGALSRQPQIRSTMPEPRCWLNCWANTASGSRRPPTTSS